MINTNANVRAFARGPRGRGLRLLKNDCVLGNFQTGEFVLTVIECRHFNRDWEAYLSHACESE